MFVNKTICFYSNEEELHKEQEKLLHDVEKLSKALENLAIQMATAVKIGIECHVKAIDKY